MSKTEEAAPAADTSSDFDLSQLDAADESKMTVTAGGKLTDWVWVFAGPGHPATVEQSERLGRQRLHKDRELEQQKANGRKVKIPEETTEEVSDRNVSYVLDRLLDWYRSDTRGRRTDKSVTMNGSPYPFTRENARLLLKDPRKISLLIQALEFLGDEQAFTQRSATS